MARSARRPGAPGAEARDDVRGAEPGQDAALALQLGRRARLDRQQLAGRVVGGEPDDAAGRAAAERPEPPELLRHVGIHIDRFFLLLAEENVRENGRW